MERTLSIIRPDVAAIPEAVMVITSKFEAHNLKVIKQEEVTLTLKKAIWFYEKYVDQPFFDSVIEFMTSGPIVVTVLEGKNAVRVNRNLMGTVDPRRAKLGTIRRQFGKDIYHNAVHGSADYNAALREIAGFFPDCVPAVLH